MYLILGLSNQGEEGANISVYSRELLIFTYRRAHLTVDGFQDYVTDGMGGILKSKEKRDVLEKVKGIQTIIVEVSVEANNQPPNCKC